MAIAMARCEYKGRAKGGNSVRSAAYNARSRMTDQRIGLTFDSRKRAMPGDIHMGIFLPEGAPKDYANPLVLWNAAEAAEKRVDSQVAREVVLALPKELGADDWQELVRRVVKEQFTDRGIACQVDIHTSDAEDKNPHAHILATCRRLGPEGFDAKKARDLDPAVSLTRKGRLNVQGDPWGVYWRDLQDRYFKEQGLEMRVDPLHAESQTHRGPKRFRADETTEIKKADAEMAKRNEAAWRDPMLILELMTKHAATFRGKELDRQLRRHIPDVVERAAVKAGVLACPALVEVFDPKTGEAPGRYTTLSVVAEERQTRLDASALAHRTGYSARVVEIGRVELARPTLRTDQREALHRATGAEALCLIIGRAGTGKSYTLGAIAEAYSRSGYEVVGLGPTHVVGNALAADPSVRRGGTLHSELFSLEKGYLRWAPQTVVLVDEAGMVDTPTMKRLLEQARSAGAKVVLVGDDRQLQSVARGGMFREFAGQFGAAELTVVTRQKEAWQRQASEDLSKGRVREAITAFDQHGAVDWTDTKAAAMDRLVLQWRDDSQARPERFRFVLAYTNDDVHDLNSRIRAIRAERGEVGYDVVLNSEGESRVFAVQDRVQITKTDKAARLFNGEVGTIEKISEHGTLSVRLDSGKSVSIDSRKFDGFRLGYAGTVYKSQGRTIDETYLLHTTHWRAESAYVALSRQVHSATVFVGRDQAADLEEMVRQCSRADERRAATSYCSAPEAEMVRKAREAASEKVREAGQFAERASKAAIEAGERIRVRPTCDRVSAYIAARVTAGELWDRVSMVGRDRCERHEDYPAFIDAQQRRHDAVKVLVADSAAVIALRQSKAVPASEVAADHLMAVGVKTRAEAEEKARRHSYELGLEIQPKHEALKERIEALDATRAWGNTEESKAAFRLAQATYEAAPIGRDKEVAEVEMLARCWGANRADPKLRASDPAVARAMDDAEKVLSQGATSYQIRGQVIITQAHVRSQERSREQSYGPSM